MPFVIALFRVVACAVNSGLTHNYVHAKTHFQGVCRCCTFRGQSQVATSAIDEAAFTGMFVQNIVNRSSKGTMYMTARLSFFLRTYMLAVG